MKKLIYALIFMIVLTGCSKESDATMYKDEALRLLHSNIDENFIYSDSEVVNAHEDYFRYYFTAEARDLIVTVDSYIEAGVRKYETDYFTALANLYIDDVLKILGSSSFDLDEATLTLTINNVEDISKLAQLLYECEQLISKENVYHNNGYFTLEHPFLTINVKMLNQDAFDYQHELCGYFTEDEIYQFIYTYYQGIE